MDWVQMTIPAVALAAFFAGLFTGRREVANLRLQMLADRKHSLDILNHLNAVYRELDREKAAPPTAFVDHATVKPPEPEVEDNGDGEHVVLNDEHRKRVLARRAEKERREAGASRYL